MVPLCHGGVEPLGHHRQCLRVGIKDLWGGEHLVIAHIVRGDPKPEQDGRIIHG